MQWKRTSAESGGWVPLGLVPLTSILCRNWWRFALADTAHWVFSCLKTKSEIWFDQAASHSDILFFFSDSLSLQIKRKSCRPSFWWGFHLLLTIVSQSEIPRIALLFCRNEEVPILAGISEINPPSPLPNSAEELSWIIILPVSATSSLSNSEQSAAILLVDMQPWTSLCSHSLSPHNPIHSSSHAGLANLFNNLILQPLKSIAKHLLTCMRNSVSLRSVWHILIVILRWNE